MNAQIPQLEANLPAGMHLKVVNDASNSIREAVWDVQKTLAITIALVVLVIYLFLRRFWATMIPALAVPLSIVATFGFMYWLNLSIDNISLLALTLAVGLVVDDAIVMLENIVRYVEEGMSPFEAAIKGSAEVTATIVSMSLSLVAVFLPILLMGGVVGRVLNEFGVVVSLSIMASAVVSLTVTPMLTARLPNSGHHDAGKKSLFDRINDGYGRSVAWCLDHKGFITLVFLLSFAGSGWLFATLPRSFFPSEDNGLLTVSTQARQDISYEAMVKLQAQAAAVMSEIRRCCMSPRRSAAVAVARPSTPATCSCSSRNATIVLRLT